MTQAVRKESPIDVPDEFLNEATDQTPVEDDTPPVTPSWFSRTYGEQRPDDMAEQYRTQHQPSAYSYSQQLADKEAAYEAYRKRLEERFVMAQRLVEPNYETPFPHELANAAAFPTRPDFASKAARPQHLRRQKPAQSRRLGVSPAALMMFTFVTCALGGFGGFVASSPESARGIVQSGLGFVGSFWFEPAKQPTETVVAKKAIRAAHVEVRNLTGAVNSPIPLDITAFPADRETPVALRISGLPETAYLTKGTEVSKGEWMLKAEDIRQAELIVPRTDKPQIALQVETLEARTGEPAAPAQSLMVALDTAAVPVPGVPQPQVSDVRIEPANATPNQLANLPSAVEVPVPLQSLNPEAQAFLSKGDRLLGVGDLLAARQFYLKAFNLKATTAAFGVGQTYDPAVYAKFKIRGLKADAQLAAEWYGKAAADGNSNAITALEQLPAQP